MQSYLKITMHVSVVVYVTIDKSRENYSQALF